MNFFEISYFKKIHNNIEIPFINLFMISYQNGETLLFKYVDIFETHLFFCKLIKKKIFKNKNIIKNYVSLESSLTKMREIS